VQREATVLVRYFCTTRRVHSLPFPRLFVFVAPLPSWALPAIAEEVYRRLAATLTLGRSGRCLGFAHALVLYESA